MKQPFWPIAVSSGFYERFDKAFLKECAENDIHAVELSLSWRKLTAELCFAERPCLELMPDKEYLRAVGQKTFAAGSAGML